MKLSAAQYSSNTIYVSLIGQVHEKYKNSNSFDQQHIA